MEFTDTTVLHLLGQAGRDALLDQVALAQLSEASFDTSLHPLEGPFALEVARVDVGEAASPVIDLEGQFVPAPGALPGELRLKAHGFAPASAPRADLVFRGTLIARHTLTDDRVEAVTGGFALLDLDREIVADLGALPGDGAALETERRKRLLERLRKGAAEPELIDDGVIESMLADVLAEDVGSLLDRRGTASFGSFALKFKSGGAPVSVPVQLALNVAALVRPEPLGVSGLLAETRAIQAALSQAPALQAPAAELRRRTAIPVLWFVPATVFDDNGWPGADRAARRNSSADLLGSQGVVIVPV